MSQNEKLSDFHTSQELKKEKIKIDVHWNSLCILKVDIFHNNSYLRT